MSETNSKEVYTVDDVQLLLDKYLKNEITNHAIAKKAVLKVLLSDLLNISTVGIPNKNRSELYQFIADELTNFKQMEKIQTPGELLKYLNVCVTEKLNEIIEKNAISVLPINYEKEEKDDKNTLRKEIEKIQGKMELASLDKRNLKDNPTIFERRSSENRTPLISGVTEREESKHILLSNECTFHDESQNSEENSKNRLIEKAKSCNFQPRVILNKRECELELERQRKLSLERKKNQETERMENEVMDSNSNEIVEEQPMVQIHVRTHEIMAFSGPEPSVASSSIVTQDAENSGTRPKTKHKSKGRKKHNRSTHHINISHYLDDPKKEDALVMNAAPAPLSEYAFKLNPVTKELYMEHEPNNHITTQPVTELTIDNILFWPGVGIKLSLPEMEIVRYCNGNIQRDLVHPNGLLTLTDKRQNSNLLAKFYKNKIIRFINPPEKDIILPHVMVLTYLELVRKSIYCSNFAKRDELEKVLIAFLKDFSKCTECYLKTSISYFCGNYQFYRVFHPKSKPTKAKEDDTRECLVQREIYNPEIVFTITRCNFEKDKVDLNGLMNYFDPIIFDKNPNAINEFNQMLDKNYSVFCVDCKDGQTSFTGPMKVPLLEDHLGRIFIQELCCANCNFKSRIKKLCRTQWKHKCANLNN